MSNLKNYGKVTGQMMKTFNEIANGNEKVFAEFMEELATCSEKEQKELKELLKKSITILEEKWRSDKSTSTVDDGDEPVSVAKSKKSVTKKKSVTENKAPTENKSVTENKAPTEKSKKESKVSEAA